MGAEVNRDDLIRACIRGWNNAGMGDASDAFVDAAFKEYPASHAAWGRVVDGVLRAVVAECEEEATRLEALPDPPTTEGLTWRDGQIHRLRLIAKQYRALLAEAPK